MIETNLFISIAAVAFLWANVLLLGLDRQHLLFLSLQVFFSTWFIYQVSRWIYYKKGAYANTEELVMIWFEQHPRLTQASIVLSGIMAILFTLLLKWPTILVLCIAGAISVLYPFPVLKPFGISSRLRDIPYIKIFLIAFVWSVTSVILPATEQGIHLTERNDIFLVLLAQFIFILFITLPFDINDADVDRNMNVKTIPSVLGIRASQWICLALGIVYAFLMLFVFMLENWRTIANPYLAKGTFVSIWALILLLQAYTFTRAHRVSKWMIKLVYDGSMILYFFMVLITLK